MKDNLSYQEFLNSADTLRVYAEGRVVFTSSKDRLGAILEYLEQVAADYPRVIILDKVVGRAAALLAIKAGCQEIYSPRGSQLATEELEQHGITYSFDEVVPYIRDADGENMCPMEQLSQGKNSDQFYALLREKLS